MLLAGTSKLKQDEGCVAFQDAPHQMSLQASQRSRTDLLGSTCQGSQDVYMSEGLVIGLHW